MKLLRHLFLFREFVLIALIFITIERIVSERQLVNYINPDYNIFINLAMIILFMFAGSALIYASGRSIEDRFSGAGKYIIFLILVILMNIPHDNTVFYSHLQSERDFNYKTDDLKKDIPQKSAISSGAGADKSISHDAVSGNRFSQNDIFMIEKDNFFSATEDIFAHPEKYQNSKIGIKGFVYKSKKLKMNRYIIARLVMYCCAADAGIAGLIFNADKTGGIFKKNEWLELSGYIEMQDAGKGEKVPVLVVESFKNIPAEPEPYIYPVY